MLGAYVFAILSAVGTYTAGQHVSDEKVSAARWEASDAAYVVRAKVDSLASVVNAQARHIRRLERIERVAMLPNVQLVPLGPPAPEHHGFFGRIFGFLRSKEGNG